MAIEAPLSRYKKQNYLIIMIVLIGVGAWFAYDGYVNKGFIKKHTQEDGTPDPTLVFHHKSPPFFIIGGLLMGAFLFVVKDKKIAADENELRAGKTVIAYDSIEKINKTHFDSKGYFILTYMDESNKAQEIKISDRTYDNLPAVLDKIVEKISS